MTLRQDAIWRATEAGNVVDVHALAATADDGLRVVLNSVLVVLIDFMSN